MHRTGSVASLFGSVGEWYDYVAYGFAVSYIAPQFFPSENPFWSVFGALGAFASGFLMRPLGGVLFGHVGDRYGRRTALVVSMILMGLASLLMGVLPTYDMIGYGAPVLLVLLRLAQGVSVGGQLVGTAIFVTEHAPPSRHYAMGGITFATAVVGMLFASAVGYIVAAFFSEAQLFAWAWRLPFIIGSFVLVFGMWLRWMGRESAIFQRVHHLRHPFTEVLVRDKRRLLAFVFVTGTAALYVYVLFVTFPAFVETIFPDIPRSVVLLSDTFALLLFAGMMLLSSWWADWRQKPRTTMFVGGMAIALLSVPTYFLVSLFPLLFPIIPLLGAVFGGMYIGPMLGVLVYVFPARTRYTGFGVGYNLGFGAFGGLAPLFALYLARTFPTGFLSVGLLVASLSLVGPLALLALPTYHPSKEKALKKAEPPPPKDGLGPVVEVP